jgi:hypothetical protein
MKNLILLLLLVTTISNSQNKSQVEPFLPAIISKFPNVRDLTISKTGDEAYFTVQSYLGELSAIVVIKKENTKWLKPIIVNFSGQFHDTEPFLSPNGLKLYFASNRPLFNTETKTKDFDIWFVERKSLDAEWSEPINIGVPINTEANEFYPAITDNENLYFTSDMKTSKGKDDIFLSTYENGNYTSPISLSSSINSEGYEFNAYVSPDESILIYTAYNRKDGFGSGDLYASTKNENGEWSTSKNLGEIINSDKMDYCPFIDFNNNTLYFTSKRNEVETTFKTKQSLNQFLNEANKYQNGMSRLYKIPFKL